MNAHALKTAVADIQQADATIPTDLDGLGRTLADLDTVLEVLGNYSRQLSVQVENLPHTTDRLMVEQPDGAVAPGFICSQVAIHVQAAAAGIDQARTAVKVAHQLHSRLRLRGP